MQIKDWQIKFYLLIGSLKMVKYYLLFDIIAMIGPKNAFFKSFLLKECFAFQSAVLMLLQ